MSLCEHSKNVLKIVSIIHQRHLECILTHAGCDLLIVHVMPPLHVAPLAAGAGQAGGDGEPHALRREGEVLQLQPVVLPPRDVRRLDGSHLDKIPEILFESYILASLKNVMKV